MKIQLKTGQTPNDDLSLIRDNVEKKVFDDITSLQSDFVNDVELTVGSNVGTPTGSATVSNNTLSLSFDNVKGNQGLDGDIGNQGKQGDSAVFDTNDTTSPDLVLSNTTGDSAFKSMTQKSISELSNDFETTLLDIINGNKYSIRIYGDGTTLESHYIVNDGDSFEQELLPSAGYVTGTVTVTMGQTDITSTSWDSATHTINITSVTDNVSINVQSSSVTDTNMFTKRTTGNGITILNDKALLKGVRGNSGIWTQFRPNTLDTSSMTVGYFYKSTNYTLTLDEDGVFTMSNFNIITTLTYYHFGFWFTRVTGHKYYISCQIYIDTDTTQTGGRFGMGFTGTNNSMDGSGYSTWRAINTWVNIRAITELYSSGSYCMLATYNASSGVQRWLTENTSIKIKNIRCIDLTKLFGAGNEPTTTAEFEKLFPIDNMYGYTTGIILNNSMTNYISKRYDAVGVNKKVGNYTNYQNVGLTIDYIDGTYTISGQANSSVTFALMPRFTSITGHKYYCYFSGTHSVRLYIGSSGDLPTTLQPVLTTITATQYAAPTIVVSNGTNYNETFDFWIVDVTSMFGAGKEPTLAECNNIFSNFNYSTITSANFDDWNLLQNANIDVSAITGKLNGEGESVVVFPNGMKSTVCLPSVTPDFIYKSDSKASYIDLDYVPTGTDIVIKCKIRTTSYISSAQSLPWFCCEQFTYAHNEYAIFRRTNTSTVIYVMCGANREKEITGLSLGTNYEIEMSSAAFKINGTTTALDASYGVANTHTLKLLGGVNAYLYYFQVYKGEDLVIDCIPYRNGEVVGLQDRARNRIFTLTQASGEGVIYSRESTYEELPEPTFDEIKQDNGVWKAYRRISDTRVDNTVNTNRTEYAPFAQEEVYVLDNQTIPTEITVANQGIEEIKNLPYDAEVEYIGSTGTEYINTGLQIKYDSDVVVEQRARVAYNVTNVRQLNGSNGYGYWGITSENKFEAACGTSTITAGTSWHDVSFVYQKINGNASSKLYIDGVLVKERDGDTISNSDYYDIFLFAIGGRNSAAAAFYSNEKISMYQILFDNILVRDYIPVRKNGVGYMYDKVSGQLFGKVGTGNFTYGNDVSFTPTTAPAIMEIQYGAIPSLGNFLLGNINNDENDNIDNTEGIEEEDVINEEDNERETI